MYAIVASTNDLVGDAPLDNNGAAFVPVTVTATLYEEGGSVLFADRVGAYADGEISVVAEPGDLPASLAATTGRLLFTLTDADGDVLSATFTVEYVTELPTPTVGLAIPTFAAYTSILGEGSIPEARWTRYSISANRVIKTITHGRSELEQTAEDLALLAEALCVAAEALYAADTFVASEKVGGYQVNFFASTAPTREDAYVEARRVLKGTGLTFSGLGTSGL